MSELALHDPSGEIVPTDPTGGRLVAWAKAAHAANSLAKALASTSFVPKTFQGNASDATAAIILGDELGLSPISALRSIYVIGGQPALYARTMVALVLSHGHRIWTVEDTPTKVTVAGQRRGTDRVEQVTWTIDRAKKAGYTSNRKYESDPQAMLWARAAGDVARRIAPDVLAGCPYSVEEMELEAGPSTTTVSRSSEDKPRVVARQPRKAPEPPPEPEEPPLEPQESPGGGISHTLPVELDGEPLFPEQPEHITPAQMKALQAAFRGAGVTDRETRLNVVANIIGRPVGSNELTKAEASKVLDHLTDEVER